jgi:phage-related protein
MGTISAPLDELMEFTDQIQEWLDVNRLLNEGIQRIMEPIFSLADWTGNAAQAFSEMVREAIIQELGVLLQVIQGFLEALNAVIDAIQAIIEALESLNPLNWF